jgi:DNA polymerase-3 subunit gamma/tau
MQGLAMASQSLYRKWRSQTFSDLVGQEPIARTLRHAVRDGRLAHAYLFCGPRGTGKTSAARLLARAVNCANPQEGEPCGQCLSCREIAEGRSPDVIEIDAASNNSVDNIRDLREHAGILTSGSRYRVYVIDEAQMLSTSAFNALLKTLEEPPPHIIFVLATTEPHKVLPTIVSRCQRFDFRRISHRDIVARLRHVADGEDLSLEPGAADLLARAARGGLRDALSLLDQARAFSASAIALDGVRAMLGLADPGAVRALVEYVADDRAADGLHLIHELVEAGADLRQLNSQIAEYWRALLLARAGADVARVMDRGPEEAHEISDLAQRFSLEELAACARVFAANETPARGLPVPQLGLELSFLECLSIRRRGAAGVASASAQPATPAAQGAPGNLAPRVAAPTTGQRPVAAPSRPAPTMSRPEAAPVIEAGEEPGPELAALDAEPMPRDSGATGAPVEPSTVGGVLERSAGYAERSVGVPAAGAGAPSAPAGEGAFVVSEALPTADAPSGVPDASSEWLTRAQSQWVLIRKVCKQRNAKLFGFLNNARPVQLEPGDPPVLIIEADYELHLKTLREPTNCVVIEWALEQVLNAPLRARLVLAGGGAAGPAGSSGRHAAPPSTSTAQATPLLRPAPRVEATGAPNRASSGSGDPGGPSNPGAGNGANGFHAAGASQGQWAAASGGEGTSTTPGPGLAELEAAARADPIVREILRSYPATLAEVRPIDPEEAG